MSPENLNKLKKLRKKLDILDNSFIILVKKRNNIVNQVLKLKKKRNQIVDKTRINQILKNIKKKSIKHKIDPLLTAQIWKSMIWSYINYQKRNFKKK